MTYIQTVKREGRKSRWAEALLQVVVSGFAGMLTMLLSWYIAAPPVVRLHGWPGWFDGIESTGVAMERRATGWMTGEGVMSIRLQVIDEVIQREGVTSSLIAQRTAAARPAGGDLPPLASSATPAICATIQRLRR